MPYGIYVHIPFCVQKCSYCDFLSFPGTGTAHHEPYIDALLNEAKARITAAWQQPVSIFIGGGTPSVLEPDLLAKLLAGLRNCFATDSVVEWTMEANPGTLQRDHLEVMRDHGVNRLSLGVQSFDDTMLSRMGRCHRRADVHQAVAWAREVGIARLNLDLMYGLPGMTADLWDRTLEEALALAPDHLSLYQLQVEAGTAMARRLARGQLPRIDDVLAANTYTKQQQRLAAAGFHQYEISNYARVGYESVHNCLYWRLDPYLGIGLGATSWQRPTRVSNGGDLQAYIRAWQNRQPAPCEEEVLTRAEQMAETMIMGLRMQEGISCARFQTLYGVALQATYGEAIASGLAREWLMWQNDALVLTENGRLFGNEVFMLFL